jgi:flagellar hook-associated protein FlgK
VAKLTNQVGSADSLSALAPVDSADSPVTSPVNSLEKLLNRPDVTSSDVRADLDDWRTSLLKYLRDPSAKINKDVQQSTFKYVLHNDELY